MKQSWLSGPNKRKPAIQFGFAYLAVLFLVAAVALSMSVVTQDTALQLKREKEQDWYFVGNQYKQAIASYYHQSPDGLKMLPKQVDELLLDKRFVAPVRHLRKAYRDPLTNQPWELIKSSQEQLIGVRSNQQQSILSTSLLQKIQTEQDELGENTNNTNDNDENAQMMNDVTQKKPFNEAESITHYHQVMFIFKPKEEVPKEQVLDKPVEGSNE
jgi:hypothetical protein